MQDQKKSMEERREGTSSESEKQSKPGYATLLSDLLVKLKKDLEIEKRLKNHSDVTTKLKKDLEIENRLKTQSDVTTKQGQRPELNSKYMNLDSLLLDLLIKMAKENRKEKLIKEKSKKGPKSKKSQEWTRDDEESTRLGFLDETPSKQSEILESISKRGISAELLSDLLDELKRENGVEKKIKEEQSKVAANLGFETSSSSMLAAILGIRKHLLMVISVIDNLNF